MKGTLLLALLVTGELSFQTSESGTLVHPISVPWRYLSGALRQT
uniref:Secretoglobin, family 2B, member 15 n=1 Tax=Mus musculus TaxID=10090 RepID=S4R2G1_MOUSE